MADEAETRNDARGFVTTYWPIAAALLLIAASWGENSFQLGNLAEGNKAVLARFDRQDEKIDRLVDRLGGYQAATASMQATQLAAGTAIVELQKRVRDVELRDLRR